mgnify:CR=1 FL=1
MTRQCKQTKAQYKYFVSVVCTVKETSKRYKLKRVAGNLKTNFMLHNILHCYQQPFATNLPLRLYGVFALSIVEEHQVSKMLF